MTVNEKEKPDIVLTEEEKEKRRKRKNELTIEVNNLINLKNPTNFHIRSVEKNGYWKTAPTLYWNSIELSEKGNKHISKKFNIKEKEIAYILVLPYHAQLGIKIPENNEIELEENAREPETTQIEERLMKDNNNIAIDRETGNVHPRYAKEKSFLDKKAKICQFVLGIKRGKNEEASPTVYKEYKEKNPENVYVYKSGRKETYVHKKFFYPELDLTEEEAKEKMKDAKIAFDEFLKQIGLIDA